MKGKEMAETTEKIVVSDFEVVKARFVSPVWLGAREACTPDADSPP